jgi:hypothetical protein
MTSTAMIDRCKNLHRGGIATSRSSSSHFATTAATHHSLMMSLPRRRGAMTNLAWRLPCRQLPCQQGRFSSPCQEGLPFFWYVAYVFLPRPQPTTTTKVHQRVVARVVNCSRHGNPLAVPPHRTVTQHVG